MAEATNATHYTYSCYSCLGCVPRWVSPTGLRFLCYSPVSPNLLFFVLMLFFKLYILGLICVGQVWTMTLSKPEHHTANQLPDETSKPSVIHEIQVACPMQDTYCIPRTRCAFRSVVYDREGLRFMQGVDSVKLLAHLSRSNYISF